MGRKEGKEGESVGQVAAGRQGVRRRICCLGETGRWDVFVYLLLLLIYGTFPLLSLNFPPSPSLLSPFLLFLTLASFFSCKIFFFFFLPLSSFPRLLWFFFSSVLLSPFFFPSFYFCQRFLLSVLLFSFLRTLTFFRRIFLHFSISFLLFFNTFCSASPSFARFLISSFSLSFSFSLFFHCFLPFSFP